MKANIRILVVEDDAPSLELVVYLLHESGYTVVSATNGKTGVEVAQRQRPDLIICDINLPKLDGYGVIRSLKEDKALKDIPVVAVTALAMVGDRSKILSAGFDGYITKPIEPETFVREVTCFLPADQRPDENQDGAIKAEASSKT